jgi:hypothetical protein
MQRFRCAITSLKMEQSNPNNYLSSEKRFFESIEGYFNGSSGSYTEKTHAFPRFVPRQAISYFLARANIFSNILSLHGSILDFGIYRGSSFFTWQHLSSIMEPYNHIRKIIGFDSFQGFSKFEDNDTGADGINLKIKVEGGMSYDGYKEIQQGIELFDLNRPLGHIERATCYPGVLPEACERHLEEHPETIIALANFGLGLYSPTKYILELIKPRLVKGSILVFEDLNQATWPGETKALFDVFSAAELRLNRVPFCPHISWAIIGH